MKSMAKVKTSFPIGKRVELFQGGECDVIGYFDDRDHVGNGKFGIITNMIAPYGNVKCDLSGTQNHSIIIPPYGI